MEAFDLKTLPRPVSLGNATRRQRGFARGARKIAKRALRITTGVVGASLVCVLLANWLAIPTVVPKTSKSLVNAPVVGVRADLDGAVQVTRRVGDAVARGDVLASSVNPYINEAPVLRLQTDRANLEAELAGYISDLETARDLRDKARLELDKYRDSLVRELDFSLQQADAKIAELATARDQAQRLASIGHTLAEAGVTPNEEYKRAAEDAVIAERRLEQARAEKAGIANQLNGAAHDVYTQRDSPIFLTLYMQFQQAVASTETKVIETRKRLGATVRELGRVDSFEHKLAAGAVLSPAPGVVWRINSNSSLVRGETLIEIAESQSAFIEAQFQEGFSGSQYPGAKALIKVSGHTLLSGKVRGFRQTSPADLDSAYAMRLPRRMNQLKVYIDLDRPELAASLVGRQCRVLVADRDASPFRGKGSFLERLVEWLAVKLFLLLGW